MLPYQKHFDHIYYSPSGYFEHYSTIVSFGLNRTQRTKALIDAIDQIRQKAQSEHDITEYASFHIFLPDFGTCEIGRSKKGVNTISNISMTAMSDSVRLEEEAAELTRHLNDADMNGNVQCACGQDLDLMGPDFKLRPWHVCTACSRRYAIVLFLHTDEAIILLNGRA